MEASWLCTKEHMVDALALRADERRDKLRKASGEGQIPIDPEISEWGNLPEQTSGILTPIHNVRKGTR